MSEIRFMDIRFIDIPEYFLIRYTKEINAWAENIRKIGLVKGFVLREGHLSDLSPDPEQGAQLIQVKLKCRPWSKGVEILPYSERDKKLIRDHCKKLQDAGLPADAFTQEPERPWLPFMPDRISKQ